VHERFGWSTTEGAATVTDAWSRRLVRVSSLPLVRHTAALSLIAALVLLFLPQVAFSDRLPTHTDFWTHEFPNSVFLQRSLRAGELPLWNPYILSGTPHFADPQSQLYYLPQVLLLLFLPAELAWRLSTLLHFFLAAAFTYAFLRELGTARLAAVFGGTVYSLSQYFLFNAGQTFFIAAGTWLPLTMLLCRRAVVRLSPYWGGVAGVVWALQLFKGLAQLWYFTGLFVAVYFAAMGLVALFAQRQGLRRGVRSGARLLWRLAAPGLAFALAGSAAAAVVLLPALELLPQSHRAAGFPLAEAVSYGRLTVLNLFGAPGQEVVGAYAGAATLLLALFVLLKGWQGEEFFFAAAGGVVLAASFGEALPVYAWLYQYVPGFSLFHNPHRLYFLAHFSLSVLAARGAARAAAGIAWDDVRRLGVVAVALLAAFYLALGHALQQENLLAPPFAFVNAALWGAVTLAVLACRAAGVLKRCQVSVLVLGILVADLATFSLPQLAQAYESPSYVYGHPASVRALGRLLQAQDGLQYRMAVLLPKPEQWNPELLRPNTTLLYPQLMAMQGYILIRLSRYNEFFSLANPIGRRSLHLWLYDPHSRMVDLLGVRYVVTPPEPDVRVLLMRGPVVIRPGQMQRFVLPEPAPGRVVRITSALGEAVDVPHGTQVATVVVVANRQEYRFPLRAGVESAEHAYDRPDVAGRMRHSRPAVTGIERASDGSPSNRYAADFVLPEVLNVGGVRIEVEHPQASVVLHEINVPLALERRLRLVERQPGFALYENTRAMPRAFIVHRVRFAADGRSLYNDLRTGRIDVHTEAVLPVEYKESVPTDLVRLPEAGGVSVARVVEQRANRLRVQVNAAEQGLLVLTDTWYPGWQARVDGRPAPLYRADVTFRAVPVPRGEHEVDFLFLPRSWILGATITLLTTAVIAAATLARLRGGKPAGGA
jgi:hypothetical protein